MSESNKKFQKSNKPSLPFKYIFFTYRKYHRKSARKENLILSFFTFTFKINLDKVCRTAVKKSQVYEKIMRKVRDANILTCIDLN